MEETVVNSMSLLTSYGALGICTVYFMVKDWTRGKKTDEVIQENTTAIKDFTVAMKLLCAKVED